MGERGNSLRSWLLEKEKALRLKLGILALALITVCPMIACISEQEKYNWKEKIPPPEITAVEFPPYAHVSSRSLTLGVPQENTDFRFVFQLKDVDKNLSIETSPNCRVGLRSELKNGRLIIYIDRVVFRGSQDSCDFKVTGENCDRHLFYGKECKLGYYRLVLIKDTTPPECVVNNIGETKGKIKFGVNCEDKETPVTIIEVNGERVDSFGPFEVKSPNLGENKIKVSVTNAAGLTSRAVASVNYDPFELLKEQTRLLSSLERKRDEWVLTLIGYLPDSLNPASLKAWYENKGGNGEVNPCAIELAELNNGKNYLIVICKGRGETPELFEIEVGDYNGNLGIISYRKGSDQEFDFGKVYLYWDPVNEFLQFVGDYQIITLLLTAFSVIGAFLLAKSLYKKHRNKKRREYFFRIE